MPQSVFVLGRFPPPYDGQALATQRLAQLLEPVLDVQRLNTSPPEAELTRSRVTFRGDRVRHYLSRSLALRRALGTQPTAPVLWAAISPAALGHWRDVLTVLPSFAWEQPVYAIVHWGNFDRLFRSPLTRYTARLVAKRMDGFVFLNRALAARCAEWVPPEKQFVVPNTVSEDVLCHEDEVRRSRRTRARRDRLRLLFLSNMIPSKGYMDVLHAVHILHQRGISLDVSFAGRWESDADRSSFHRMVHEYELENVVAHLGGISDRQHIKTLYLNADIFLLPTYYPTEAQPLTIIEALNTGTPVISTPHAGIPHMVRHDDGALLVPPRDPDAIVDAVLQMRDPGAWYKFSEQARERFNEYFSPESVRNQWVRLLN